MHIVYLGLGSNLGTRLENLVAAIKLFPPEVHVSECSPIYETPPWGYQDQPRFLNQVVKALTDLNPQALLDYVKDIEREIGRKKTFLYGPRSIDIDILFYDDLVIDSPPLHVPHPRLQERAFVLIPMADLDPQFQHPVLSETIECLLNKVDKEGISCVSSKGCHGDTP